MFPKFIPSSPLHTCYLKTSCFEISTHFFLKCPYFKNPHSCWLKFLLPCKNWIIFLWDSMQCKLQATQSFQSNEDCGQMTFGPACAVPFSFSVMCTNGVSFFFFKNILMFSGWDYYVARKTGYWTGHIAVLICISIANSTHFRNIWNTYGAT